MDSLDRPGAADVGLRGRRLAAAHPASALRERGPWGRRPRTGGARVLRVPDPPSAPLRTRSLRLREPPAPPPLRSLAAGLQRAGRAGLARRDRLRARLQGLGRSPPRRPLSQAPGETRPPRARCPRPFGRSTSTATPSRSSTTAARRAGRGHLLGDDRGASAPAGAAAQPAPRARAPARGPGPLRGLRPGRAPRLQVRVLGAAGVHRGPGVPAGDRPSPDRRERARDAARAGRPALRRTDEEGDRLGSYAVSGDRLYYSRPAYPRRSSPRSRVRPSSAEPLLLSMQSDQNVPSRTMASVHGVAASARARLGVRSSSTEVRMRSAGARASRRPRQPAGR